MAKIIGRQLSAVLIPAGLILFLYFYSRNSKGGGGFHRYFVPHPLGRTKKLDLKFNSFYFAGESEHKIYLGNRTAHRYLLTVSDDLNFIDSGILILPDSTNTASAEVHVMANTVFLSDGNKPFLFFGLLPKLVMSRISVPAPEHFTAMLPMSNRAFVLRTYSNKLAVSTLTKITTGDSFVSVATNLLQKSVDGYYSCDGTMCMVSGSPRIIYVYRYRNQFIVADSNLNLVYRSGTIDTIRTPQIRIGSYKTTQGSSTTFAAPPRPVNNWASASEGLLYIQSMLKADNEEAKVFNQYFVIDVYDLSDGHYKFSFYLPRQGGQPLKDFIVAGKLFYILYDHFIQRFELTF